MIEHKPYGEKADVFSFGIVLWELLTGRVPYSDMTPLQAAVGVVQQGLRPAIPPHVPPALAQVWPKPCTHHHQPSVGPSRLLSCFRRQSRLPLKAEKRRMQAPACCRNGLASPPGTALPGDARMLGARP